VGCDIVGVMSESAYEVNAVAPLDGNGRESSQLERLISAQPLGEGRGVGFRVWTGKEKEKENEKVEGGVVCQ